MFELLMRRTGEQANGCYLSHGQTTDGNEMRYLHKLISFPSPSDVTVVFVLVLMKASLSVFFLSFNLFRTGFSGI